MAHGQPDYGLYQQKKTTYGLPDSGELAARLGSIVTYDRRGDIIWLEDFSCGRTNWASDINSTETATQSTAEALSCGFSMKLQGIVAAATHIGIIRRDPLPVDSDIGMEFAFMANEHVQDLRLDLLITTPTITYYVYIRVELDTDTIYYWSAAGAWVQLATGVDLKIDRDCWHHLKLVVDFGAKQYVRLLLDDVEYNMAGLGLNWAAFVLTPFLQTSLYHEALAPIVAPLVYIDDVIFTQNELP